MKKYLTQSLGAVSVIALNASLAMAEITVIPDPSAIPELPNVRTTASPADIVALIFRTVIILAGAVFLLLLLYGGVTYMLSGGNDETTEKAKKIMSQALIGLVLIIASYAIGIYILRVLGYNV